MSDVDGVLVSNILKQQTTTASMSAPPPPVSNPVQREKHVHFADDLVNEELDDEELDDEEFVGGLIKKNNIYITMLENIKPAIIAGIVVALFQIDMIKSFIGTNISGVFSPDLSIYGFFVFIVIGAILFWVGNLMSRANDK